MKSSESGEATRELLGRPVADELNRGTEERWRKQLKPELSVPCLASIAVGEGSPFHLYQRQQKRAAEKLGLAFRGLLLSADAPRKELEATLRSLDSDPTVHGIILQHPLPPPLDFFSLISEISATKDVDGVGEVNLGRLVERRPLHVPAVALATTEILRHYHIPTSGAHVVVVGRSETVGIPTALLYLGKGPTGDATVTVTHSKTRGLSEILATADIIVSCAGSPGIVHRGNVRKGATVIDVGLAAVEDPNATGGVRMAGDSEGLAGWAGNLTPVPGGVGPVTVAELLRNTVMAWELSSGLRGKV